MTRIYVAGPMRGIPEHNQPAFRRAADLYRTLGYEVVSPVEIGNKLGGQDCGLSAEDFVRADLRELLTCSAIALLTGWEKSTGARCEITVALTLGFRFFDANGFATTPPGRVNICGGYDRPPGAVESLDLLVIEATDWADATFTRATNHSRAEHLYREAAELKQDPFDAEEMADVFMLLGHIARHANVDLAAAVRAKLEKNRSRKWGEPDALGVVEHIAEGTR